MKNVDNNCSLSQLVKWVSSCLLFLLIIYLHCISLGNLFILKIMLAWLIYQRLTVTCNPATSLELRYASISWWKDECLQCTILVIGRVQWRVLNAWWRHVKFKLVMSLSKFKLSSDSRALYIISIPQQSKQLVHQSSFVTSSLKFIPQDWADLIC